MDAELIFRRLTRARSELLKRYPFYGRLLLKLRFGLADCGTAYTDTERVVFDPGFAARLSDEELIYLLVHELLHCVLKHCTRGSGKQHFVYNVACDIVVNSTMLEMFGRDVIVIDGAPIMHVAPDGSEGRENSAEAIYAMLMRMAADDLESAYPGILDDHTAWDEITDKLSERIWDGHILSAARTMGEGNGVPSYLHRYLRDIERNPRTNWRSVLHDFIRFDRSDYDFVRPDNRYTSELFMPAFCDDVYGSKIEKLWFLADTSGSVDDEALSLIYGEICQAIEQIGNVSGYISYFDHMVYDPEPFESVEEVLASKPRGGGGTNFPAIFDKLGEFGEDERPSVIVIMTDGYGVFPPEEVALGIPVIWAIVDSPVEPAWGEYTYIMTE